MGDDDGLPPASSTTGTGARSQRLRQLPHRADRPRQEVLLRSGHRVYAGKRWSVIADAQDRVTFANSAIGVDPISGKPVADVGPAAEVLAPLMMNV